MLICVVKLPSGSEMSPGNESEESESGRERRFRDEVRREELDDEEYDHIRG